MPAAPIQPRALRLYELHDPLHDHESPLLLEDGGLDPLSPVGGSLAASASGGAGSASAVVCGPPPYVFNLSSSATLRLNYKKGS